jgi:ribosomal protein L7/L12
MDLGIVVAVIIAVVGFGLIIASRRDQRSTREAARLTAVERKLDAVMKHLEIEEPAPSEDPEVVAHLVKGEFIQAIKVYRDRTGAGLAEAKDAVEQIAHRRGLRR